MAISVRPPGNKFEWRRSVSRQRQWVDDPELWTSIPGNSGANELESDPVYGLRMPRVDGEAYTQGNNIDLNLTDVRVVVKWNSGDLDLDNPASMEICLRESANSLTHLTCQCWLETGEYYPAGGDNLNMVIYPVSPGVPVSGFFFSQLNPTWNNYNGTGVFGTSADSGARVWFYEWSTPPEHIEAGVRPNTDYWMVAQVIGNTITMEHWLTDPELGAGSPEAGGTITMKAPTTPRPGYETSDIDRRTALGAGVYGTVGVGYVEFPGKDTYGIREYRVFDMSGGRTLLITIAGLSIYTSDYLASGGPTTQTIDGTEDVFVQPITILGAYAANAHILESVGSVAPTFSLHNFSGSSQLRWQIYDSAGNRGSGIPNGVISVGGTSGFDLASVGPGRYFLVVSFDSAPHTGSYRITAGPANQLVAPDTSVEQKVEVFPPEIAGFSVGGLSVGTEDTSPPSITPFSAPSLRPPGDKFEYRYTPPPPPILRIRLGPPNRISFVSFGEAATSMEWDQNYDGFECILPVSSHAELAGKTLYIGFPDTWNDKGGTSWYPSEPSSLVGVEVELSGTDPVGRHLGEAFTFNYAYWFPTGSFRGSMEPWVPGEDRVFSCPIFPGEAIDEGLPILPPFKIEYIWATVFPYVPWQASDFDIMPWVEIR